MKIRLIVINVVMSMGISAVLSAQTNNPFPKAKIHVNALDENGVPIADATVDVSFPINTFNGPILSNTSTKSDSKGVIATEGICDGNLDYIVRMDGFYKSAGHYHFLQSSGNHWLPWDPSITVVLKRIVLPVALYAKSLACEIPGDAYPIGFDLVKSDWVKPYGTGEITDFVMRVDRRITSKNDYDATLRLAFPDTDDGIAIVPYSIAADDNSSILKLPREAPVNGYQQNYTWYIASKNDTKELMRMSVGHEQAVQGYFFRVRAVRDAQGRIIQAIYGKIQGDVSFSIGLIRTAHSEISFTYCLNPTGERNLEFDREHNLFGTLPIDEQVHEP